MQHKTTDLNRTSDPDAKGIVDASSAKVYLNNYGKPHMPKDIKGETFVESQNKAIGTKMAELAVSLPIQPTLRIKQSIANRQAASASFDAKSNVHLKALRPRTFDPESMPCQTARRRLHHT